MGRDTVRPFSAPQIELVNTFADQAVIAIENARLLSELRQALEQQTATSEVLQVISSSPGDLEPVFAAMLEKAVRICGATFGNIYRWDGDALRIVALHKMASGPASHARRWWRQTSLGQRRPIRRRVSRAMKPMKIMDSGGPRIFHRFRQITKVVTDRSARIGEDRHQRRKDRFQTVANICRQCRQISA